MKSPSSRNSVSVTTAGISALSGVLLSAQLLLIVSTGPVNAREQWQIPRSEPAPTGPYTAGRFGGGNSGGNSNTNNPASGMTPPFNVTAAPALPPSGMPQPPPGGVTPDFFKQFLTSRLSPGTILTGVIENDLSSGSSKKGELFAILLEDGYAVEGKELIPKNSRILGSVNSTHSAAFKKHGFPGQITISLQTLVFPDGRTSNFNGFIDHNPAHDQGEEPKTKYAGFNFSDYGQSMKGMLFSSVAGIGGVHKRMIRGKEFSLKKGTSVAVKVNRTVDLSAMKPGASNIPGLPLGQPSVPGLAAGAQGFDAGGMPLIPGLTSPQATAGGAVPGLVGAPGQPVVPGMPGALNQPFGTPGIPGLPGTQISPAAQFAGNQRYSVLPGHLGGNAPNAVPGMVSNPVTQSFGFNGGSGGSSFGPNFGSNGLVPGSGELPPMAPNFGSSIGTSDADPNSIFKNPINAPSSFNMPDPF